MYKLDDWVVVQCNKRFCWFAGSQLRQKCRNRFRLHFCSTLRLRQNSVSLFFSRFPVKLGFALKVRKNYSGVASGCARSCPRTSPLQGCLLVKDRCFFQDEVLDSFLHQSPAHSLPVPGCWFFLNALNDWLSRVWLFFSLTLAAKLISNPLDVVLKPRPRTCPGPDLGPSAPRVTKKWLFRVEPSRCPAPSPLAVICTIAISCERAATWAQGKRDRDVTWSFLPTPTRLKIPLRSRFACCCWFSFNVFGACWLCGQPTLRRLSLME